MKAYPKPKTDSDRQAWTEAKRLASELGDKWAVWARVGEYGWCCGVRYANCPLKIEILVTLDGIQYAAIVDGADVDCLSADPREAARRAFAALRERQANLAIVAAKVAQDLPWVWTSIEADR